MARQRQTPKTTDDVTSAKAFRRAFANVLRENAPVFEALATSDERPASTDVCRGLDGGCNGSCTRHGASP